MRIAYLITAYDQPEHLGRMVRALACSAARFHIHIDAKVDLAPFEQALAGEPRVHFASRRLSVQWMGFSQVASILGLMQDACEAGADYCVLLSGSDYPIKSNAQLLHFFETACEEYLTFWRLQDRPSWQHKIEYHYPIDRIAIHGWSKGCDPVWLRRLFWGRFHQYRHLMPRRSFPFDMVPYGGSDWWMLSAPCVRYVLTFVHANPRFVRFYRSTHCPSEMFFHTIVLNSPFRRRVRNAAAYDAWSARTSESEKLAERSMLPEASFNLRYIDWDHGREGPSILDERDWDRVKATPALFARKFHPRRSDVLLRRIDAELLHAA